MLCTEILLNWGMEKLNFALVLFFFIVPLFVFSQGDEIPMRADSCFELKLDYEFKQKKLKSGTEINYMKLYEKNDTDLLPFVKIDISLSCIAENEYKLRILDNRNENRRTIKLGENPINFEIGFTEDVKERIVSHQYQLIIIDKKKIPINQILFQVEKDGTFLVNGVVNGKF